MAEKLAAAAGESRLEPIEIFKTYVRMHVCMSACMWSRCTHPRVEVILRDKTKKKEEQDYIGKWHMFFPHEVR